jgi:HEPN domain-containing protein
MDLMANETPNIDKLLRQIDTEIKVKENFTKLLKELENLALEWKLIDQEKYKFRSKHYGTHNEAITNLLP